MASQGNAHQKVSEQDTRLAWELFDQILAELGHLSLRRQTLWGEL